MTRLRSSLVCALCLLASHARAQSADDIANAKAYFKAGASAYEMGDYQAAIQALEVAHRLTPLPAIDFSLAQAERRQYLVSRERAHLERSVALFRTYLQRVARGGRRADATDALGQLEPLLALQSAPETNDIARAADKTRLMISCEAPSANVSLDGAAPIDAPLIEPVAAGSHRIRVAAKGFFPIERTVEAIAGELVPVEIALRELPAVVIVRSKPAADLYIDGSFAAHVEHEKQLELASGRHLLTFTRDGYRIATFDTRLGPGTTRNIAAELEQTGQRTASLVLLASAGVGALAGAVVSGLAVDRENEAKNILDRRSTTNIGSAELTSYADAAHDRNRLRVIAIASFTTAAVALVTGLILYAYDEPNPREQRPEPTATRRVATQPRLALSLSDASGMSLQGHF